MNRVFGDDAERALAVATPARFGHLASNGRHANPRHLQRLDRALLALAYGEINRLMVLMPPRHGKSTRCSQFFPAWYLGMFPDRRVMLCGYEAQFAADWGRKARDALAEVGPDYFGVNVRQDSKAASRWNIHAHEGGMITAGVGGALTGRGSHLLIIDDAVKNADQALSETYREKQWNWYLSTAETRLEPGGAVLQIQTRWHEDDLAGRTLAAAAEVGERWTVLQFPAIAVDDPEYPDPLNRKPGEALWPERYPVDVLDAIRRKREHPAATLVANWWESLFQQNPTPREGGMFELKNLPVVASHAPHRLLTVRYWDKAASVSKDAARTAGVRMSVDQHGRFVVEHARAGRWAPAEREQVILQTAQTDGQYVAQVVEQEGGSSGADAILATSRMLAGYHFEADKPSGDKETRAEPFASQVAAGNVVIVDPGGKWSEEYRQELRAFPRGKLKDLVDASSGAFNWLARRMAARGRGASAGRRTGLNDGLPPMNT